MPESKNGHPFGKTPNSRALNAIDHSYHGKRVLVTGGYGFVGSHIARRLLGAGAEVWLLDVDTALDRPSLINCPGYRLRSRVYTVTGDITQTAEMTRLFSEQRFDYVFNCAAHAAVIEKAVNNPAATVLTNTMGLVNLLEAIRQSGHMPSGIFHASTDKVYGELDGTHYEEDVTPLRAIGIYDSSKLAADVLARSYHEVFGLPVTILRLCNLFGPYDFNLEYRLIPKSLNHLFSGRAPELYEDSLDHQREYLYVDDAVAMILELTADSAHAGEAYNLMACDYLSTREAMDQIVAAAALAMSPHDSEKAQAILERSYEVVRHEVLGGNVITLKKQRMNAEKLRSAISHRPQVRFTDGLFWTAEFYRRISADAQSEPNRVAYGHVVAA